MFYADPGIGKSTLVAQIMAQLSTGMPLFGALELARPYTCYYIQFERDAGEILERLAEMEKVIRVDYSKIIVDDRLVGINLLDPNHAAQLIKRVQQYSKECGWNQVDIVPLDPIYASVRGGLSTDEKATMFTRASALLQKNVGCSNLLLHHATKASYASETGDKIDKDDSFYGSVWLKAHVTGSFHIQRNEENGTTWTRKKDNYSCLMKKFNLKYDPASYLSYLDSKHGLTEKRDRVRLFINSCFKQNRKFVISEVCSAVDSTDRYVRELLAEPEFKAVIEPFPVPNSPTLFMPKQIL